MVEENAIRADITPWDEARIAVDTVPAVFETIDAAVAGLYASVSRQRRHRIRAAAEVVEQLGDLILEPETWSRRRLEQVAAACRGGYAGLMQDALREIGKPTPVRQWEEVFVPILREAGEDAAAPEDTPNRSREPRRFARPRRNLAIRRVRNTDGWSLRFTGPDATSGLMEDVMDYVESEFGREG